MMAKNNTIEYLQDLYNEEIAKDAKGKSIKAKTTGQRIYVDNIKKHDLTLGIGPAGKGKTFLAVVMAWQMLRENQINRIGRTRRAVEEEEKLGYLRGELTQ